MPNFKECNQLCQYNTTNGCKVIEMNGVCPLSNSTTKTTQMAEARTAESYEAEIKGLAARIVEAETMVNELKMDNSSLEFEISGYKQELDRKEMQIEFMRGQIEAFKFCVSCGNAKKKGE